MAAVFTLTFSQNKAYARETPTRVRGDRAGGTIGVLPLGSRGGLGLWEVHVDADGPGGSTPYQQERRYGSRDGATYQDPLSSVCQNTGLRCC